jgi:hypothetical protein
MSAEAIKKLFIIILAVFVICPTVLPSTGKIEFWNTQRKGTSSDAGRDPEKWFAAAADVGIEFIRLVPVNWQSRGRDFLLGDAADDYLISPSEK